MFRQTAARLPFFLILDATWSAIALMVLLVGGVPAHAQTARGPVVLLTVDGAIGPAYADPCAPLDTKDLPVLLYYSL
jgi:hypothetical protein